MATKKRTRYDQSEASKHLQYAFIIDKKKNTADCRHCDITLKAKPMNIRGSFQNENLYV